MSDLAPLTPADCDLRDFPFMPVDIVRLFGSQFHAVANDAEWRAGLTLWLKSFHQVPAASLPDDDVALARLAEFGRDLKSWMKVKQVALRGWKLCSDGLLYHPVVAEKANEALERKRKYRERSRKANDQRWGRVDHEGEPHGAEGVREASESGVEKDATGIQQASNKDRCRSPKSSQGTGTVEGTEEEKERKDGGAGRARSKRPIPINWAPSETDVAYSAKEGFTPAQTATMAERFANHARQQDRRCAAWEQAWRNWVLEERKRNPIKPKRVTVW